MKKNSIFIAIVFLLSASVGYAQNNAEILVKQVVEKMNKHKNIEISFDYRLADDPIENNGKGYIQGKAYKLEIEDQQTISNGETLWTYQEKNKEVMISEVTEDEGVMLTPLYFLTHYNKDYNMRYVGATEKGTRCVEMTSAEAMFNKILLTIDTKKREIKAMRIYDTNGNMLTVNIQTMVFDQNLPDTFFSFDTESHPDIEVIDMR